MVNVEKYDGYLSFLPTPTNTADDKFPLTASIDPQKSPHYRQFHSRDFCWFEWKYRSPNEGLQFDLRTDQNFLWILIQLLGDGKIALTPALFLENETVYCYHTQSPVKPVSLDPGKSWFFLLGIVEQHWQGLAEEYPLLQQLPVTPDDAKEWQQLGQMPIQAKLRTALDALRRFEFRPFSLSFRLATWNLRLFNLVFQELKTSADPQEDTTIALHYKATRYMNEHFRDEDMSVEKVADAMHVSVRTLYSSFQHRPFSVMGYLQELRLLQARSILMDSQDTIASISFACHFTSEKHFSRLFKKRFGKGPNEYRMAVQGNVSFKNKRRQRT